MADDRRPVFIPAPRRSSDPLPPPRYPENPSPWARLGRAIWAYLSRLR